MKKRNTKRLALNLSNVTQDQLPSIVIVPSDSCTSTSSIDSSSSSSSSSSSVCDMQQTDLYQQGPARILPNLYLGACYNAVNTTQLDLRGITCIVNVASEVVNATPLPHIEYHHIRWTHSQRNLAQSEFDQAIEVINKAHSKSHIVLVHCQQGIERSAALVLAFLLKTTRRMKTINDEDSTLAGQNWSLDRALNFVKEKAPGIRPNMELLYQLREYEETVPTQCQIYSNAHNIKTRTKRSESVACSKPSTRTLLASSSSLRSLNKVIYHQRPRSASFRDVSPSASSLSTTQDKECLQQTFTSTSLPTMDTKCQALAITSLLILLTALYQRELCCTYQRIDSIDMNDSALIDGSDNGGDNQLSSRFLKPVCPIY